MTWRAMFVLGVAGLVPLAACGGDDESSAAERDEPSPPETEVPETDPEVVRPLIAELLLQYDEVVNEIVADPSVARDPEDSLIQEYLGLFEPGNEPARELIDLWVTRADEGLSTQPFSDELPASRSRLDGEIELRTADEVAFPICVERRHLIYDGAGRLQQRTPYREQPGDGVAVRVDGQWRLRERVVFSDTATCRTEGP